MAGEFLRNEPQAAGDRQESQPCVRVGEERARGVRLVVWHGRSGLALPTQISNAAG